MNSERLGSSGGGHSLEKTKWDDLGNKARESDAQASSWDDLGKVEFSGAADRKTETLRAVSPENTVENETGRSGEEEASEDLTERPGLAKHGLEVIAQDTKEVRRPAAEMEPGEVAREYLDILRGLGANFTSPEGASSRLVRADGSASERGYSGDKEFVERIYALGGMKGEDMTEDLDKALNLRMVDSILEGEQRWRDAGEEYGAAQETVTKANERLERLKKEGKSMGLLGKIRTFGARRKEKKELQAKIVQAQATMQKMELKTKKSDKKLGEDLRAAYSEDYHYGHHRDSYKHASDENYQGRTNEEYNERFAKGHEEEISRAIELRKALLDLKHGKLQGERPPVDDWYDSLQRV